MISKKVFNNYIEAAKEAGLFLTSVLNAYKKANTPVLFLVSGGSSFNVLESISLPQNSRNLTVGVLDERYSMDSKINNFLQLERTNFFISAKSNKCSFINTSVRLGEDINQMAKRFKHSLDNWLLLYPSGKVVITQGMGLDGHTSGILPFPEDPKLFDSLFNDKNFIVTSYDAKTKNPYPLRVTTTLTFLRKVDLSVFIAFGEDKKNIFDKVISSHNNLPSYPAQIIHEMKDVNIFTDIK